ncbi:tRNA pseudouridine synthase A [Sergentomyia squamirostris]
MLKVLSLVKKVEILGLVRSTFSFAEAMSLAIDDKKAAEANKTEEKKTRYNGWKKKRNWESKDEPREKRANLEEPFVRIKRKKSVILLGYSGKEYYGMQRNPDVKTVEEELLSAMLKHKWITEESYKFPQGIAFQRAARTDKGVSAVRQCVSIKLPLELDIPALNEDLPKAIKVFAVRTATQGFNAKNDCMARTYTYTFPTVALVSHIDKTVTMENYRVSSDILNRFRDILKMYEGSKNYHNFTARKEYLDPSCNRYILSFTADEPFIVDGVEFVVLRVKGQSFMMHQIRKMVGLALIVIRGHAEIEVLHRAFTQARVNVPRAPGLGLVLDTLHYDRYNRRYGSDGIHTPLEWTEFEEEIQKFVKEEIYPVITNTEIKEKAMVEWLEKLYRHDFSENAADNESNDEGDETEDPAEGPENKETQKSS